MSTTIKYPTSTNAVQKTLDAQLLSGVTAAITLNNVTGIQDKEGVCVIDAVDANGTATPAKREYIKFTGVSGSTLTGLTRNADGGSSDQDHAVGAIVQFGPDVLQQQAIIDSLLTEHNEAGTHKSATVTTLKATGAEINTGTEDAKIVTPKAIADSKVSIIDKAETLTNKTLTSPKINEDVALTATATQLNAVGAGGVTTRLLSKAVSFTRDGTAASGDVSITGIGFQPTSIKWYSVVDASVYWSNSSTDSNKQSYGIFQSDSGVVRVTSTCINYSDQVSFGQSAIVKTYDADGFTLTWTKAASPPAGTITVYAICYR